MLEFGLGPHLLLATPKRALLTADHTDHVPQVMGARFAATLQVMRSMDRGPDEIVDLQEPISPISPYISLHLPTSPCISQRLDQLLALEQQLPQLGDLGARALVELGDLLGLGVGFGLGVGLGLGLGVGLELG